MKSTKGTGKIIPIIILLFLLIVGGVYAGFAYYFSSHFFYGTVINGMDCQKMTVEAVKWQIQDNISQYSLTLNQRDGKTEVISAQQLGLAYADNHEVEDIREQQKPYAWITALFTDYHYQVAANTTYDQAVLESVVDSLECFQEGNVTAPQDAYINDDGTAYTIVPEVQGNTLNNEAVKQAVAAAVDSGQTELDFEAEDLYEKPSVLSTDETLTAQKDQMNQLTAADLTYDLGDDRIYRLNRDTLKEWLVQGEDGTYTLAQEQIAAWVQQMAYDTDTFGLEHQFTTSLGPTITLAAGGDYGWVINQEQTAAELSAAIAAGTTGAMEPVYLYKGVSRGINDIGGTYVEVCISQQKMWCYQDGQLVVETDIVTGNHANGYDTPSGSVWAIDAKMRDADFTQYNVSVTFWLPFNDGVGIHDASWRSAEEYGGDTYLTNGSHGCVNTPYDAAEQIFNVMEIGYPVVVYYSVDEPVGTQPTQEASVG